MSRAYVKVLTAILCGFSITATSTGWALDAEPTAETAYQFQPVPNELKHYETEIFRLVDNAHSVDPRTKKDYYDPRFAIQFDKTVKSFSSLDKRLKKKLLSGPAPQGRYIAIGNSRYLLYSTCQAHWCNVTNIYILYQPEKARMIGRLMYACGVHKFGDITNRELRVIDQISPIRVDEDECKLAKEQK